MRFCQFCTTTLVFLGSILLSNESFAQFISVWHEGNEERQRIVIPQETKDYIIGLFQKGFAHRDQIKSGQMDIAYDIIEFGKSGNIVNKKTREVFLAFDGERHRVDRRVLFQNKPLAGNITQHISIGCIGCYNNDRRLLAHYTRYAKKDVPASHSLLSIFDTSLQFNGKKVTTLWTEELNFIPQYIVYLSTNRFPTRKTLDANWDLFSATSLNMLDSGATSVTISDEDYKDVPCKKIVFETKWDDGWVRNSLWFSEGQGYALLKHHYESGSGREKLLEIDVARDKDSGLWFPSAWHYGHNEKGKPQYTEDGTIKNVVLNKPIDEKVFTMEDIKDIPAGAMVFWNTDKFPPPHGEKRVGALLWDGNKIVTRGMFAESMVEKMADENRKKWQSKRFKVILCVNIAGISLILALILWRYYKRL